MPQENATVTVAFGGKSVTFELSGTELSEVTQSSGKVHRYFTNASRDFVAEQVLQALLQLVPEEV